MKTPLYRKKLGVNAHKLLWWLLAHQKRGDDGVPTGMVEKGWRAGAMKDIGIKSWNRFGEALDALRDAGVVECKPQQRTLKIIGEAFE